MAVTKGSAGTARKVGHRLVRRAVLTAAATAAGVTLGLQALAGSSSASASPPVPASPAPASPASATSVPASPTSATSVPAALVNPFAATRPFEVIGHRSGFEATPENTLSAIRRAVALGADAVEIDMVFTRDGRKAIFHDLTLDRTTTCTGPVDALTWRQLRRCDAGIKAGPQFAGERVPSLEEALAVLEDTDLTVYLHVRDVNTPAQARSILDAVRQHGMDDGQVVIFAGKAMILRHLEAAGGHREHMGQLFSDPAGWNTAYGTLVPYRTPITRALVDAAHARGKRVLAVESRPLTARTLGGLNLDGYMANDLAGALRELRD